uniref:LYR motif-containing protein 9 n=1 Tax=Albugo laibachii Nc14 TaxID=890382 RepID=F0W5G3_9STRA|nr:AlNc14C21G2129 [Albugo laibachii Nc14]|eukprot:CCA16354.1 AlNc14C21G2129 [Albugo laibachii Nc14]
MESLRRESIALYRKIFRETRRLKPHERDYYRLFARGGFIGHSDEIDPARIKEIHERVLQDMEWILKKYTGKGLSSQ